MERTLWLRISAIATGVIALDQLTKSIAQAALHNDEYGVLGGNSHHLVGPVRFSLVYNPGVAFGIGSGHAKYLVMVAILIIIAVLIKQRAAIRGSALVGIGLVLGGAIGNVIDRLFRNHAGRVVDFIDIWRGPVFNLADAAVVVGAFTLAIVGARTPTSDEAEAT